MTTVTHESAGPEPFTPLNTRRLGPIRRYFLRRPRAMDALVMLLFAGSATASVVFPFDGPPHLTAVWYIGLGTVALAWRRTAPLAVATGIGALAALCTATTGTLGGFDLAVGLALYAVAVALPVRRAWITSAVLVATTAAAVWLWEEPVLEPVAGASGGGDPLLADDRVSTVTGLVIISLAAMAVGISVRNRRQHLAELVERANALARDREQQAELARVSERTRIAREMHDVVAHSLAVMVALADGAGAALDRAPEASRAALGELSATGRTALADMRRVLGVLDDGHAPLEPQPGRLDLETLVERFRAAGVPVVTDGLDTTLPDDPGIQLTVYRVVQESLTNTLRHAPGTARAELSIRRDDHHVEVEVVDLGANGPVTDGPGSGRGLVGMAERAGVYGGSVSSGPWRGGWRVHVVLPWEAGPR